MTDNKQPAEQHTNQKTAQKTNAQSSTQNSAEAKPAAKPAAAPQNATPKAEDSAPKMKKVSIAIAGVTYSVFCPVNEEAELRSAVYYINNFALDIKKESPNINQENLLLLSCLNLYEKIHAYEKADAAQSDDNKKASELLSKIVRDAKTIL